MGTIAEKLEYLNTTKTQLREAINNRGGSLTSSSPFRDYVDAVSAIPSTEQHANYTGPYTATENGTLQTAGKAMTENVVVDVPARGLLEAAWEAYKERRPTNWDDAFSLSSATNVFSAIESFDSFDFSGSENVTSMKYMFEYCASLKSIPLFNTSKVTNMSWMFAFTSLVSVPAFDTSSVTSMERMFTNCDYLTSVPLFDTSNVNNMDHMFYGCSLLTTVPAFNTSKVTNMSDMFASCGSLTSVPAFDTSSVTNMTRMFNGCYKLKIVPAFDTSKVTADMSRMFTSCSLLEEVHMFGMKVDFNIAASTKFTREALLEIINNCADMTGGYARKLTMGSTNLAKLTEEDIAIATNKNWTLA